MISPWRALFFGALAASTAAGQSPSAPSTSTTPPSVQPQGAPGRTPAEVAREEIEHPRATAAGVAFMTGMIGHHGQAVVIAGWCPSHGASATVRAFCERVAVSQLDEIKFMRDWLAARHQPLPPTAAPGDGTSATAGPMRMSGMDSTMRMPATHEPMRMPGMLTAEQLATLDQARGPAFDRLFLEDMIRHHQGAIEMVQHLTESDPDDDDALMMYATNVAADQAAEIGLMQRILATLAPPDSH